MTRKEVRELLAVCDGCGKAMLKYTGAFCSYCTPLPQIQFLKKKLRKEVIIMERVITNEDVGRVVPCPEIDINPYCQITRRGYNMSCERCREGNSRGPYWEQFLRQDNRRTG